jgi:acyl-CoA reductase-like NAD-dependent aldehyde dehydrogenase
MNKSETKRMNELIESSDVILKERDALRRQVKDIEMQRANLLAEVSHMQNRVMILSQDKIELLEETIRLNTIVNEMAQVTLEGFAKLQKKQTRMNKLDYYAPLGFIALWFIIVALLALT